MRLLYRLGVACYGAAIALASPFNAKAKQLRLGRKNWEKRYAEILKPHQNGIWMHCASLGEFEQGRPLLEAVRASHPHLPIVLSFSSPSGFEPRKNWPGADAVIYLPLDSPRAAHRLIQLIAPKMALWVKYEFWFSYMRALQQAQVPLYLVSGVFRANQHFFKWWGGWFRTQMLAFTHVFVQDQRSLALAESMKLRASRTGDTRFDRVASIAQSARDLPVIEHFKGKRTLVVAGSSWPTEEGFIAAYLNAHPQTNSCFVVVPHEVDDAHINQLLQRFGEQGVLFSAYRPDGERNSKARVLIVDRMGLLSSIYRYADLAVIGGGFGRGIHNTLEAAVYGIPVLFGSNFAKFNEAHELLACGGAQTFANFETFEQQLTALLENSAQRERAGAAASTYIQANTGATSAIMRHIFPAQ